MRPLIFAFLAIIAIGLSPSHAHEGKGGLSLEPDPSVRSIAVGHTLLQGDAIDAFTSNPSCLTKVGNLEIALKHSSPIEHLESSLTSLWMGKAFGSKLQYPGSDVPSRRFGLGLALQHRSIDLAQGSRWSSNLVFLGVGYGFAPYASTGLTLKLLSTSSDLGEISASGYGIDLGTHLELTSRIGLDLSLHNVLGSVSWHNASSERPPVVVSAGLTGGGPFGCWLSACMGWTSTGESRLGLGVELPIYEYLAIRTGLLRRSSESSRTIVTGGFGLRLRSFTLDYAFQSDPVAFGLSHHFAFRLAPPF